MSEELVAGRNLTRAELIGSEYSALVHNIHNLIFQYGGDEDVVMTIEKMRDFLSTTVESLKRRNEMVYGQTRDIQTEDGSRGQDS